jgi:hypothetical protein
MSASVWASASKLLSSDVEEKGGDWPPFLLREGRWAARFLLRRSSRAWERPVLALCGARFRLGRGPLRGAFPIAQGSARPALPRGPCRALGGVFRQTRGGGVPGRGIRLVRSLSAHRGEGGCLAFGAHVVQAACRTVEMAGAFADGSSIAEGRDRRLQGWCGVRCPAPCRAPHVCAASRASRRENRVCRGRGAGGVFIGGFFS